MNPWKHALTLALVAGFTGCNQPANTDTASTGTRNSSDHGHTHPHPHAHGDEARDHSVAGHAHGAGPHSGTIADWGGGKFHVEFTVDHKEQQATVYILGNDEKTAVPIDAASIELSIQEPELQVTLNASPQESDPPGKASRFMGNHEKLGEVKDYAGTITGVVDGIPYSGDFQEVAQTSDPH